MKRRDFGLALTGGVMGAATGCSASALQAQDRDSTKPRKKAQMYVAEDHWDLFTKEHVQYLQRHGVKHVEVEHLEQSEIGDWDLDELKRLRDLADKRRCGRSVARGTSDFAVESLICVFLLRRRHRPEAVRIEQRRSEQAEHDDASKRQRRRAGRDLYKIADLQRRHKQRHQQHVQHTPPAGPFDDVIGHRPVLVLQGHPARRKNQQGEELAQRKDHRTQQNDDADD